MNSTFLKIIEKIPEVVVVKALGWFPVGEQKQQDCQQPQIYVKYDSKRGTS